ncbi:MAG: Mur ligase family protein [Mycoplasmoidaceae bacterium]
MNNKYGLKFKNSPCKFKKIKKELNWDFLNIKIIHVLGTNGKGSVCHFLNNVISQNKKVGLFTSPHILFENERIKINNNCINTKEINKLIIDNELIIQKYELSFFEKYLLIAISYFLKNKVDIIILEAGIGGLFDSTNFIKKVDYICIPSITYDHMDVLGSNIFKIMYQKFWVIKFNNKKVIVYIDKIWLRIFAILISIIKFKKIFNVYQKTKKYSSKQDQQIFSFLKEKWTINSYCDYQINNATIAIAVLLDLGYSYEFINSNINQGYLEKSWEINKIDNIPIVMDGAHNVDGINKLCQTMKKLNWKSEETVIIFNAKMGKDPAVLLKNINNFNYKNIFLYSSKNSFNQMDIEKIPNDLYTMHSDNLNQLFFQASKQYINIIFTGSIYFIGEIKKNFNLG